MELPIGTHLNLILLNRSRTGMSTSVSVHVIDGDSRLVNISKSVAETLGHRWNPVANAVIVRHTAKNAGNVGNHLVRDLGTKLHANTQAFTWAWL